MVDIARLSGVSTSTVSRALSHSPLVNQETRDRILDLARSLNYTVNIGAQNLRLQQNRTVAVVVPIEQAMRQQLSDPFFLSMLGSLADVLSEQGFDALVSRVDADRIEAAAASFDAGRAIGMILIGQGRHHEQLNRMAARGVPFVVWGAQLPQQLYATVGGDNFAGGRLATEHLLAQGRRRIAFVGDTTLPEVEQRHRGYVEALAAVGQAPDPQLHVAVSFLPESGGLAVEELARRGAVYDGLFASSDLLAMKAIHAMRARGKEVPADVAVVGYDDIELASYFHPPLTTVCQPRDVAARALMAALLACIDGQAAPSVQLPTALAVRASA
jgi:DNA-binding LacI/PurR family transcriptional regulator